VYFDTTDINGKYYINGIKSTPQTVIDKPRHIGARIEADGNIVYLFSLKNYAICDSTKEVCICTKPPHVSNKELRECKLHHNKYRLKGYHNSDAWTSANQKYEGTYVFENMYKALLNDSPVKTHTTKIIKKSVCKSSDGPYNLSTLYGQRQERIIA
jgi:hypothetical protein